MFRPSTWVVAGAAVLASAGAAQAQESVASSVGAEATGAAVPWYERFTTSSGVTGSITGQAEDDRLPAPAWNVNQHWGVTVDVREAQRVERLPEGGRRGQTSVGAFYQFTPNLRVGGQVSLESAERPGEAEENASEETRAGVRVESAFRF